ncbi:MAG: enoyl-CoA hydratase [Bryobacteraceae bacterium]|nr:enoyl-CoA hydratase [Bryobacteraceae bacterium]
MLTIAHPGSFTILTLNQPARRNALSLELMRALTAALRGLPATTRVVILAAEGPVFSSGHDLREMRGRSLEDYREVFAVCTGLMQAIQAIPQPVIAEVQGTATAAGCQLVAACDLAIAADTATFATPGVKIGLFCSTPMVELTRSIGRKRALEMLLTGQPISAALAADWGLINRAVPFKLLRPTTLELGESIAAAARCTVATGKHAYYAQAGLDTAPAYALMQEVMSTNATAVDAQEGIGAFLDKRPPVWQP